MAKSKPGRPIKVKEPTTKLLLSLRAATVERLDAWVEEIRTSTVGGGGVTRTDLIRDVIERAVAAHFKRPGRR